MNTRRLIERLASWPATLTLCLLIVLGALAVKLWPRTVPFEQCSEVYKKYAGADGVDASFLKDYRINDTVRVDVTLLEAKTDSAWTILTDDFNAQLPPDMPPPPPNTVDFWYAPHDNYTLPMNTVLINNDIIAVSYDNRTISIFHIKTKNQINAILFHQITTNKNNQQNE